MKNLIFIGARGFGREAMSIAKRDIGFNKTFQLKGFLDSDPSVLDGKESSLPILGSPESYTIEPDDCFVCAIGNPTMRLKYARMIEDRGGSFINIIDSTSVVNEGVKLGTGIIVQNHCIISSDTSIGNHVIVQSFTAIGHDASIREGAHISAYVFLGGSAVVESCAQIWTRSSILPEVVIHEGATVGAHAMCNKNVPAGKTVVGVPAKPLTR